MKGVLLRRCWERDSDVGMSSITPNDSVKKMAHSVSMAMHLVYW